MLKGLLKRLLRSAWWLLTSFIIFFSAMTAVSVFAKVEAFAVAYGGMLPWIYVAAPVWLVLSFLQPKKKRKSELEWRIE